ncbi:MAG: NADH-quinone oxidoreductase subunit J [Gammaproteobacteria bacterium]|nr:NADH-quinone oxidoreductase subunit J [Gammaproteobacteria bacterium]
MELTLFYIAAGISLAATLMSVTRYNAAHGLIYLIISLLASAVIFYLVGAPFAAVLEIVIYAGAIMVLFVFVVMMLNLGTAGTEQEHVWLKPGMWIGPGILALVLLAEMIYVLQSGHHEMSGEMISPKAVGIRLFGPYVLAVELASMLLLAGLVGAYHLGRRYLTERRQW